MQTTSQGGSTTTPSSLAPAGGTTLPPPPPLGETPGELPTPTSTPSATSSDSEPDIGGNSQNYNPPGITEGDKFHADHYHDFFDQLKVAKYLWFLDVRFLRTSIFWTSDQTLGRQIPKSMSNLH